MVSSDDASVGMAHAYLVSPDDLTITHADSALASFVGSDDAITDPQNCLRVGGNTVCIQVHAVSHTRAVLSVLVPPAVPDQDVKNQATAGRPRSIVGVLARIQVKEDAPLSSSKISAMFGDEQKVRGNGSI
jgi:hypothetical protein